MKLKVIWKSPVFTDMMESLCGFCFPGSRKINPLFINDVLIHRHLLQHPCRPVIWSIALQEQSMIYEWRPHFSFRWTLFSWSHSTQVETALEIFQSPVHKDPGAGAEEGQESGWCGAHHLPIWLGIPELKTWTDIYY